MKTINDWEKFFKNYTPEEWKKFLALVLERIKFLESIYMTGEENNSYSEEFGDAAYKEREALCQESSALYNLIRINK